MLSKDKLVIKQLLQEFVDQLEDKLNSKLEYILSQRFCLKNVDEERLEYARKILIYMIIGKFRLDI